MDRWIDVQMDRCVDGQMDRQIYGQMDRWINGLMCRCVTVGEQMFKWTDVWMDRYICILNRWIDRQLDSLLDIFIKIERWMNNSNMVVINHT